MNVPVRYDFSVNLNPLGIPAAVRRYLENESVADAQRYPDRQCGKLREMLAQTYGLAKEQILCGSGASALLSAAVQAVRPEKALITAPSFSGYAYALRTAGTRAEYCPLLREEDFAFSERILQAIENRPEIVILCSPNNPVGNLIPQPLLRRIADACEEQGTLLLLDECFLPFVSDEKAATFLSEINARPHLLVLRAFTKEYAMPGLRLGWLAGRDTDLLARIAAQMPEWSVSSIAQEAGIRALSEKEYGRRAWPLLDAERSYLREELAGLGCRVYPSDANFLMFSAQPGLKEKMLARGILIRSCADFEGLTDGDYRIAVRTHEENEILIRTLMRVI